MLKVITEKLGKVFGWILICLIVLSFAIWGIGDVFQGRVDNSVATVGKRKISVEEFRNAVRSEISRLQAFLQDDVTRQQVIAQLESVTLKNMVNKELIAAEANELGLFISNAYVAKMISSQPFFKDDTGKFSPDKFKAFLKNIGKSEIHYINYIKSDLTEMVLINSITSNVIAHDLAAKNLSLFKEEIRTIDYVVIPSDYVKEIPVPSDTDLNEYYEKNKDVFSVPEIRDVSYVKINPDVAKEVKPSDEQVKSEYEKEKASFVKEEARDVEQLHFENEAAAKKAYEDIKATKTTNLASYKAGGDYTKLEAVRKKDLPTGLAIAAFALPKGQVGQPVQSSLGWHIFAVSNISYSEFPAFEKVQAEIRRSLEEKLSGEFAYKFINSIEDEIAGGSTLEEIAKKFSLKIEKSTGLGNRKAAGDELKNSAEFVNTAFSVEQGQNSGVIASKSNNTYFVVRADSVTPARIKALDEVRGVIKEKWAQAKKDESNYKAAKDIAEKAGAGEKKPGLAAVAGSSFKVTTSRAFPRYASEENKELPKNLVEEVFSLNVGSISDPVKADDGDYYVAQVRSAAASGKTLDSKQLGTIKKEILAQSSEDLLEEYLSYLRTKHPVTTNNALISSAGS